MPPIISVDKNGVLQWPLLIEAPALVLTPLMPLSTGQENMIRSPHLVSSDRITTAIRTE